MTASKISVPAKLRVDCVILAAGRSERFGPANKLTTDLGGMPLAKRVIKLLPTERFAQITAVTSVKEVSDIFEGEHIECVQYPGGLLSDSIKQGIAALKPGFGGILVINADRPMIRQESIIKMLEAFEKDPTRAVRLSYKGVPSNPVLFPGFAAGRLLELTGDKGGNSILRTMSVINVEAEDASEILDIDDPQTLELIRTNYYTDGRK